MRVRIVKLLSLSLGLLFVSPGLATAQVKAARLWRFVQENGRLDLLPKTTIIDLRPESAMSVTTGTHQMLPTSVR